MFEKYCHFDWIGDRSRIFSSWSLFLGMSFIVLNQCSFSNLQLHAIKTFQIIFLYFVSICLSLKFVPQIFNTLFQTGDTNIFVPCTVISVLHFQIINSFLAQKH